MWPVRAITYTPCQYRFQDAFQVPDSKQVYRVRLSGTVVGTHVGGTFEGKGGDLVLKPGVFTGSIVPQAAGR